MTNEETQSNDLLSWWKNFDFEGKEYCDLKENGELVLKASTLHPERVLSTLNIENVEAALKALLEKFPEVAARVKEVSDEWEKVDDKLKLLGKIARLKDYLLHANAIGNFSTLIEKVNSWEKINAGLIEQNYNLKVALIENAEQIAETSTNFKETTQKIKDLTEAWKTVGYVDKTRNEDLWSRLENAKNRFFERKRYHQEDQEKELLRNLDLKMEIVEKAESVAESENWKDTTEIFRNLMDQWRTIGRTVHDKNEELWNRFILAKNNFYERKRVHFESIQSEQEQNYIKKIALVEQAESLKDSKDWLKTTQLFAVILENWKAIGRVPVDKTDELWNRMNVAKDFFFGNKRQHHETVRVEQEDNYAQKMALLKRAEVIKNSSNWKETTEEMNELFTEWKKIGLVPREHINTIWEQFIAARKHFFNRKDEEREKRKHFVEKQIQTKFDKTKGFLVQLENEIKEEEVKLSEFKIAIENITPGAKEAELRTHLEKLISQSAVKIKHKSEKADEVRKQFKDLEKMNGLPQKESAKSNNVEDSVVTEDKVIEGNS